MPSRPQKCNLFLTFSDKPIKLYKRKTILEKRNDHELFRMYHKMPETVSENTAKPARNVTEEPAGTRFPGLEPKELVIRLSEIMINGKKSA